MAKWKLAASIKEKIKGAPHSYIGWYRQHPKLHMAGEPMSKVSLVQVHQDGDQYTILGQTVAHGLLKQPLGTKGTMLFKKTVTSKNRKEAMDEVQHLKRFLAGRYDGLTRHYARGPKYTHMLKR